MSFLVLGAETWEWDGLERSRAEEFHRRKESRVCYRDLLSPLAMGTEGEERPQQVDGY